MITLLSLDVSIWILDRFHLKTTDKLLKAYNDGSASDREKTLPGVMLFQYGRYLTIESSRGHRKMIRPERHFPSNLQGIWVGEITLHGILTIIYEC